MVRPVNHLTTIIITARKKWSGPLSKPIIESAVVRDYWSLIIAKMERQNTTTNVENAAKPTALPVIWLDINKRIALWMIRKPRNVQFAGKSTFPCRPMPCIYELTIKIANAPFVAKLSRGLGCFKATYELTQVLKISILFSAQCQLPSRNSKEMHLSELKFFEATSSRRRTFSKQKSKHTKSWKVWRRKNA